jgi:MFS family permease
MGFSSPAVLFARELGASSVAIGILTGVLPLMMALQLPAANFAERIGYQKIHVYAYYVRTAGIASYAALAIGVAFDWLSPPTATVILIFSTSLLAIFRGIASGTWLPWIASIVPRDRRLAFLSNERIANTGSAVLAMLLAGVLLSSQAGFVPYTVIFSIGAITCGISTYYLATMPAPIVSAEKSLVSQASLKEVIFDPFFGKFLMFNITVQLAVGAMPTFTTVFLREQLKINGSVILICTAGALLAGAMVIQWVRHRIDQRGSLFYLRRVFLWLVASVLVWWEVSLLPGDQIMPEQTYIIIAICLVLVLLSGSFGSMFELAMARLLMNSASDRQGSTRYFAMYGMVANLFAALSPMLWGALIDSTRNAQIYLPGMVINHFSYFFLGQGVALIFVFIVLRRLAEPTSNA